MAISTKNSLGLRKSHGRRFSDSELELIAKLRRNGYSYGELASKFNTFKSAIYYHVKNIPVSGVGKTRLYLRERKAQTKLVERCTKKIRTPRFTLEKVRLIAHCLFDGEVFISTAKNFYYFGYSNNSKALVGQFINDVSEIYGLEKYFIYRRGDNYQVRFCSKKAVEDLLKHSPSYSNDKRAMVPKEVMTADISLKSAFLRAFWDDEGCIDYRGRLISTCTAPNVLRQLALLHKELGIMVTLHKDYLEVRKSSFPRFVELVGFTDGVKVTRGHNKGRYKAQILHYFMSPGSSVGIERSPCKR